MTARVRAIYEETLFTRREKLRARGQHLLQFMRGYYDVPKASRDERALITASMVRLLRDFTPIIFKDELIVGYNYDDEGAEIYGFTSMTDDELRAYLGEGLLTPSGIEEIVAHLRDWSDPYDRSYYCNMDKCLVDDPPFSERDKSLRKDGAVTAWCMTNNHSVIGHEQVLALGFWGIKARAEAFAHSGDPFYDSVIAVCDAAMGIGEKYAAEAERLGLTDIAEVCRRVPKYPARTLREAVQALWFSHIINTWEDGINANSLGRVDQILYPYYLADIVNGTITRKDALELIELFFLKLYLDYDVQQTTLGGVDARGNDAVSELSYLMLDAIEDLGYVRCVAVRVAECTPRAFVKRALEVVGAVGKGVPFFFNDDVMIPALTDVGIALKDARDYANIGCVETVIPGACNPHAVSGQCNLLKALEYALNGGCSMMTGEACVSAARLEYFDEVKNAVMLNIKRIIDVTCAWVNEQIPLAALHSPMPYKSLLTRGCLESGRDYNAGGAVYDYYQIMLMGIPNLADALMAIKTLVFDEMRVSMAYFVDQLKRDFPDESFRQMCLRRAEKFGNDSRQVDALAAEIFEYACTCVNMNKSALGMGFHAQPFTFLWMIDRGRETAASADGRRAGDTLSYSVSPMQGRDIAGLTALFSSLAKLNMRRAPGTASAIVEILPDFFAKDIDKLTDLFITALRAGVQNVQFNITDAQTLIAAQERPKEYSSLAVRVSGFSQRFVLLSRELQDHIIARTKHGG